MYFVLLWHAILIIDKFGKVIYAKKCAKNMNVETLYQDGEAASKASPATTILGKLLIVLWWIGWAGLALFAIAFFVTILVYLGVDGLKPAFESTTPSNVLISSTTMTVGVIVFLVVVKQLRLICHTLVTGDPFVPENAKRLRIIWVAVAAAEIMRLSFAVVLFWLRKNTDVSMDFSTDVSVSVWFMVMVLIILAEVFREGARMRQDAKLTV